MQLHELLIERYTLPEMGNLWSEQAKFQSWLDVEIAATEANCRLGKVPQEALDTINAKARFSVERILEIEAEVRHDVIAFLTNVNEHVGDAGRFIHVGMTSSDVLDTGLALQLKRSVALLRSELDAGRSLARAGASHKGTEMIGRSRYHGEPITRDKLAGWLVRPSATQTPRDCRRPSAWARSVAPWATTPTPRPRSKNGPVSCWGCGLIQPAPGDQATATLITCKPWPWWHCPGALLHQNSQPAAQRCSRGGGAAKGRALGHAPQTADPQRHQRLGAVLRNYTVAALENVALWLNDISHSSVERIFPMSASPCISCWRDESGEGLQVYPDTMGGT